MEAFLIFAFRLVTGTFLAMVGVFAGYLLGWVVVLSLPAGVHVSGQAIRLVGLAVGSGAGAAAAWWDPETSRTHHAVAVASTLGLALLGAWLGWESGPSWWDRRTIESVRHFAPMALGSALAGNAAAAAAYCGGMLMRRRSK
ncbi:MAG: hypothetical protein Q8P22_07570 [Chloroflexota bacterium]|nr:hypothetical protein [Chloroflexota bacterium]